MAGRTRDFKLEYVRRIARGLEVGLDRSAARGHPKSGQDIRPKKPAAISPANPLHKGFERVKAGGGLANAAKALRISRERLRRYVGENADFGRDGRQWRIVVDRRRFQLPLYTAGKMRRIIVNADGASELGRYMAAVGKFLRTNRAAGLEPFEGRGVVNASGQFVPFETDPNALYALDAKGELTFHQIYQIQI
jgi:hypothetical protein